MVTSRVAYYYDPEVGNYTYGPGHPMKPHRIRMTHALLVNSGVFRHLAAYRPPRASAEDMMQFHSEDYVRFLERVTPAFAAGAEPGAGRMLQRFNIGDDCPVIEGLFEYCQIAAGGSVAGAARLNAGDADVAVNWAGGLHHAKRGEASGFCYVNDIVLAILELLKVHARVLYIDIDVHHGDGVEEAFYATDRVMTLSLHKYGEFFPGTGALQDVGAGRGRGYSVNVPLRDGIDDATYAAVFEPIVAAVMEHYRPGAVVLQCGADSLAGDRLGGFNLSHRGHAACVAFVRRFGLPTMVLGGGGYTIRNVARCWAHETALCLGREHALAEDALPYNEYFEYYAPDYALAVPATNMPNLNTPEFLARVRERVLAHLRALPAAPAVQMHAAPRAMFADDTDGSDESDSGDQGTRCALGLDGFGSIQRRRPARDSDSDMDNEPVREDEFAEFFALEALHRRRLLRAELDTARDTPEPDEAFGAPDTRSAGGDSPAMAPGGSVHDPAIEQPQEGNTADHDRQENGQDHRENDQDRQETGMVDEVGPSAGQSPENVDMHVDA